MPSAAENHEVKRVNKFTGEYPQNYCFSYKQTRKKSLLLHKLRIFALKYLLGERINTTYYFLPRITRMQLLCVGLGVKCLEGTTERSDGNRGRSPRIGDERTMCLEFSCKRAQSRTCSGYAERSRKSQRKGTTPQDMYFTHRHRRTAFQAEPLQLPLPDTAYPVIVATLRSAFQAHRLNPQT